LKEQCGLHEILPLEIRIINILKYILPARCWWLIPVIQAAQEAEIRRIKVRGQLWPIVLKALS
jgi:hypothetical protein